MKRGIFCFPLFSIAEFWLYTSNRMIFAAQATVAFLHEDLGAEWWKQEVWETVVEMCADVQAARPLLQWNANSYLAFCGLWTYHPPF